MGKRERTSRLATAGPRRGGDPRIVPLAGQFELELVGIIGCVDGLPGSEAIESVLLDAEEGLLALVQSLRDGQLATEPDVQFCCGADARPRRVRMLQ